MTAKERSESRRKSGIGLSVGHVATSRRARSVMAARRRARPSPWKSGLSIRRRSPWASPSWQRTQLGPSRGSTRPVADPAAEDAGSLRITSCAADGSPTTTRRPTAGSRNAKRSPWRRAQVVSDRTGSTHITASWASGGTATDGIPVARRQALEAVTSACAANRPGATGRRCAPEDRRSHPWASCPPRRGAARGPGFCGRQALGWAAGGRAGPS